MAGSRTATALAGLIASLLVSAAAWYYFGTFLLFLFIPFVPLLLRRGDADPSPTAADAVHRECPVCGFRTGDPEYRYCPQDGTRLE